MAFMHLMKATFSGETFSYSGGFLSIEEFSTEGGSLTVKTVGSFEDDERKVSVVIA